MQILSVKIQSASQITSVRKTIQMKHLHLDHKNRSIQHLGEISARSPRLNNFLKLTIYLLLSNLML